MRYFFLSLLAMISFLTVKAQTDSLKQYTGKYKFPDGSVVTEIIVTLDSTGLMANSAMGSTELKKTEGDVFEIVAYGGTATFKRNAENKISGVQVLVGDINMEGTKLNAQTDSLEQYTGTYKFPDGSTVTEITVTLDSTGLTANSAMGNSELKKTEGDVFEIVAYGGTASFKRNTENKISGVVILVGDINMEGTKTR